MPAGAHHRLLKDTPWKQPTAPPPLPARGEVHLWRKPLAANEEELNSFNQVLNAEELDRSGRFYFPRHRNRYTIARATLRQLLGGYLNMPAPAVQLEYGEFGKPRLHRGHASKLTFNLSHAGGYALYGFTHADAIGVDLEAENKVVKVDKLVHRFFSPDEARQVLALPAAERHAAFYRTWTRKEAFIKAHGAGLHLDLDQFSVTVDLAKPVSLTEVKWAPGEADDWAMASFEVAEHLPGAVVTKAVPGTSPQLSFNDA